MACSVDFTIYASSNPFSLVYILALTYIDRYTHGDTIKCFLCLHKLKRLASQNTSIIPIYSITSSEEAEVLLVMSCALSEIYSHFSHVKSDS